MSQNSKTGCVLAVWEIAWLALETREGWGKVSLSVLFSILQRIQMLSFYPVPLPTCMCDQNAQTNLRAQKFRTCQQGAKSGRESMSQGMKSILEPGVLPACWLSRAGALTFPYTERLTFAVVQSFMKEQVITRCAGQGGRWLLPPHLRLLHSALFSASMTPPGWLFGKYLWHEQTESSWVWKWFVKSPCKSLWKGFGKAWSWTRRGTS